MKYFYLPKLEVLLNTVSAAFLSCRKYNLETTWSNQIKCKSEIEPNVEPPGTGVYIFLEYLFLVFYLLI